MELIKGPENGQNKSGEFEDAGRLENFDDAHTAGLLENYDRDKKNVKRKEILKDHPEEYEEIRKEAIDKDIKLHQKELEIGELKEENMRIGEDLEYVNYALENKIQEARYDAVTGLESRKSFFARMDKTIKTVLGIPRDKTLDNEEWQNIINDEKTKKLGNYLYVAFGDVSYLTVANRGGRHEEGDEMLHDTAQAVNGVMPYSARLSGDELASVIVGTRQEVIDKIAKAKHKVAEQDHVSNLKVNNLVANIDIGEASFSEALDVYKKLSEKGFERREGLVNIDRDIKNIWMNIADKRSSIIKTKDRIKLLLNRKERGEKFLGDLAKSIYGIEPKLIEELLTSIEESNDQEVAIDEFIKNQEIQAMNKIEGDHNKAQIKEVLSLLDII
jgi:GGDEF domain-containing protein